MAEGSRSATAGKKPRRSNAIGGIETNSVARGIEVADIMLKAAEVRLVVSNPVCPGKYIIMIAGEVAAVTASVEAGRSVAGATLVDDYIIPNIHPQITPAITGTTFPESLGAVGMIEVFSLAAAIKAGDAAVKAAAVDLIEIRLARALGGKSFVLLTGEVAAVRAAIEAGIATTKETGLLLGSTIIPSPHPELLNTLL